MTTDPYKPDATHCVCGRRLGWEERSPGFLVAYCPCGIRQEGPGERCPVCGGSGHVETLDEPQEINQRWLEGTECLEELYEREHQPCVLCKGLGFLLEWKDVVAP